MNESEFMASVDLIQTAIFEFIDASDELRLAAPEVELVRQSSLNPELDLHSTTVERRFKNATDDYSKKHDTLLELVLDDGKKFFDTYAFAYIDADANQMLDIFRRNVQGFNPFESEDEDYKDQIKVLQELILRLSDWGGVNFSSEQINSKTRTLDEISRVFRMNDMPNGRPLTVLVIKDEFNISAPQISKKWSKWNKRDKADRIKVSGYKGFVYPWNFVRTLT